MRLTLQYALFGVIWVLLANAPTGESFLSPFRYRFHHWADWAYLAGSLLFIFWTLSRQYTARQRSEQISARRRDSLEAIVQAAPVGIVALDKNYRVQFCSPAAERVLGLSRDELTDRPLPISDGEGVAGWEARGMAGDLTDGIEATTVRPDGFVVHLQLQAAPVRGPQGEPAGLMVIISDKTREYRAAQAARTAQRRLLLLDQVGGCLADADQTVPNRLIKAARVLVPALADWCLLDLVEPDGLLQRLTVVHVDRSQAGIAAQLRGMNLSDPRHASHYRSLLENREGRLCGFMGGDGPAPVPPDDPVLACLDGAGVRPGGMITVPIWARGRALGLITLLTTRQGRIYEVGDLALARELAARMAAMLDGKRLYEEAVANGRSLQQRVAELNGLSEAALAITSSMRLEEVLQVITDQARLLIGAQISGAALISPDGGPLAMVAYSHTEKHAAFRTYKSAGPIMGTGLHGWMMQRRCSLRLTQAEMEAHPAFDNFGPEAGKHPPLRGLLAVPIIGRTGEPLGFVQVSDRIEGEFTAADETLLTHFSRLAAVAIENSRLYETVERSEGQLAKKSRLLAFVTDHIAQGILCLDERGRLTYANRAVERITDWTLDQLAGCCLRDLIGCSELESSGCTDGFCPVIHALHSAPDYKIRKALFIRRDRAFVPVEYMSTRTPDGGALLHFSPITSRRGARLLRAAEKVDRKRSDRL